MIFFLSRRKYLNKKTFLGDSINRLTIIKIPAKSPKIQGAGVSIVCFPLKHYWYNILEYFRKFTIQLHYWRNKSKRIEDRDTERDTLDIILQPTQTILVIFIDSYVK